VLITCWSAKGGVGTTVVASTLALLLARQPGDSVLLVDLAGDVPAALGLSGALGPGVSGWLDAGPDVPADALARLAVPAAEGLEVLPRGDGPLDDLERVEVLAALLVQGSATVVVDAGLVGRSAESGAARILAGAADHSLLVLRPCFLGFQRAMAAPLRPSAAVLVSEPGRSLGVHDVEATLNVPVRAEVMVDPSIARAVDAGLLSSRLPRPLARSLAAAA
jgi:hypothetical protein